MIKLENEVMGMIDEFVIRKLAKLFTVMSNEIRIKIIYLLFEKKSMTANEIAEAINIPQNTLSGHLKILYEGGYIDRTQKWRNLHYIVKEPLMKDLFETASIILYNKWEQNWKKISHAKADIEELINKKEE
jgi:DNA-binding transcriptional ArsR family regulator